MKLHKIILLAVAVIAIILFFPNCNSVYANSQLTAPDEIWVENQDNQLMLRWTDIKNNNGYIIDIDNMQYNAGANSTFYNVSDIFTEAKDYNIKIKTIGDGNYATSDFGEVYVHSNSLILSAPVCLNVDSNKVLSWEGDSRAKSYSVVINGVKIACNIVDPQINLSNILANVGKYDIRICSNGDSEYYLDSQYSVEFTYTNKINLIKPTDLSIAPIDNNLILNWKAVSFAKDYEITIDGINYTSEINKFDITQYVKEVKDYDIKVRAKENGNFIESEYADIQYKTVTQLKTPVIAVNGEQISWESVPNAISYTVTVNDNVYINTEYTETVFDFSNYCENAGKYVIRVSANGNGNFKSSEIAEHIYNKYKKLQTPALSIENATLSWNSVENATNYSLFIDGILKDKFITACTVDLSGYCAEAKDYTVEISANANGYYTVSDNANLIYHCTVKLDKTTISVNGLTIEWLSVLGAESYTVTVDGIVIESNCKATAFDLQNHLTTAKLYTVGVFANGHGNYLDADTATANVMGKAKEEESKSKTYRLNCHGIAFNSSEYIFFLDKVRNDGVTVTDSGEIVLPSRITNLDIVIDASTIQEVKEVTYFKTVDLTKATLDNGIYVINVECIQLIAENSNSIDGYTYNSIQYFSVANETYSFHYCGCEAFYPNEAY